MDNVYVILSFILSFIIGYLFMYITSNKKDCECGDNKKPPTLQQGIVSNSFTNFGVFLLDIGGSSLVFEVREDNWFSDIINEEQLEKFSEKYGYGNKTHKNYHNPNKLKMLDVKSQNEIVELYGVLVNVEYTNGFIILKLRFDCYNKKV